MSTPYIGEIRMFGGSFPPAGWLFCNGQMLSISDNSALFQLLGTTYGGDGQSTFGVPDLRGRLPVHQGTLQGTSYPLAQSSGSETVTLSSNQLPPHNHPFQATSGGAGTTSPANALPASGNEVYSTNAPTVAMNPQSILPAGGNQAHENMMPYLAVSFIISLDGIYPSQN